jgi:DNA-directed RNA polymerase subunit beta
VPIKAKVKLMSGNNEVIESEVYLGDLPLMTEKGTFVINGAERVVVSQLSRSAGIYFRDSLNLGLQWEFFATLIPNEGPWVDVETDSSNAITVRIGQNKKFAVTTLLRALHAFAPASPEGDIEVGFTELKGKTLGAPVVDPVTGEILLEKGQVVSDDDYRAAEKALGGERAVRELRATAYLAPIQAETDAESWNCSASASRSTCRMPNRLPISLRSPISSDESGKLLVSAYHKIDKASATKIAAIFDRASADESVTTLPGLEVLEVSPYISATLEMEDPKVVDRQTAMLDIYHKIRPGDPVTPESARALMQSMFFDLRRYDMAKVGRHKVNKKIGVNLPLSCRSITKNDVLAIVAYIHGCSA